MKKILVTGAFGQIGSELVPVLQKKYGKENVIALVHRKKSKEFDGLIEKGDVNDFKRLRKIIKKHKIDTVFHLAAILSAAGEKNPDLTWQVNIGGLKNVLDLAVEFKLKVFWPSSIAVFGPTTPKDNTPQRTILEPTTMYGVTKLAGELLCQYYFLKYGVDVRSVRYPGVISWKTEPGGGTTDYAVAIFYGAIKNGKYQCFVREDTVLPMIYMDDAIRAALELMEAPSEKITIRTSYNLAAISFSAKELEREIQKYLPLTVTYLPDERQKIADSWPRSIDDSEARKDWGWKHEYDLEKMTKVMIEKLKVKLGK
ncbi:MAG: NAD-dependent epimerase/dehydratase family protein [Patescibacteria group bacterium]